MHLVTKAQDSQIVLQARLHSGISNTPNTGFPELDPQVGATLFIGRSWKEELRSWAEVLNAPITGLSIGVTELGNHRYVGKAISVLPTISIQIDPYREEPKWRMELGYGGSYVTEIFDPLDNPNNLAFSSKFNWTYRSFISRRILKKSSLPLSLGLGYIHHSNGHTRLPNQGLNSFLLSVSYEWRPSSTESPSINKTPLKKSKRSYIGFRSGLGTNVLSLEDNDQKRVQTLTLSYGRKKAEVFRFSGGVYVRKHAHYEDFINGDHALVMTEHKDLKENAARNSMSLGLISQVEFLMGHVGAELDIGFNIFKPAYPLDWKVNKGRFEEGEFVYGNLNLYYHMKYRISSRLALNYYLINVEKNPAFNVYCSAGLNANLGQADFTEISFGIIRAFGSRDEITP